MARSKKQKKAFRPSRRSISRFKKTKLALRKKVKQKTVGRLENLNPKKIVYKNINKLKKPFQAQTYFDAIPLRKQYLQALNLYRSAI